MNHIDARSRRAANDDWMNDAGLPRSREDRVAEIVTAIALVFSLGIGLVIALLPVAAKAVDVRPVSRPLQFTAVETMPPAAWPEARPAHRDFAALP
jgi:hypothetical protein